MRQLALAFLSALTLLANTTNSQVFDTATSVQPLKSKAGLFDFRRQAAAGKLPVPGLIPPAALITYGIVTLNSNQLQTVNTKIREEIYLENPHKSFRIDDYLQYAPAAIVYGLNMAGIKGKNNFRDRTIIYLMSDLMLRGVVSAGKSMTHELRPDGSNYLSFPSGHTAHAFASAEFLRQEYRDVSPFYGIAGYALAAGTGYLRMYNNRHWLSDVATGAGIGIASTKIAYWLYPKVKRILFPNSEKASVIMPTYDQGNIGLSMIHQF
jgi:PAP2 superfamily protein